MQNVVSLHAMTTLEFPTARFHSTNLSQHDPMMTWTAELELAASDADGDDHGQVIGGYASFLSIRLHEHPIEDLLDSLSSDALVFAPLFVGDELVDEMTEQFEETNNNVLIITTVHIAEELRGHTLGAWLVAEIAARMAPTIDTVVILHPYPASGPDTDISDLETVESLQRYWQKAGLQPVHGHPEFLAASTAYTHLQDARLQLHNVSDVQITVPTNRIRNKHPNPLDGRRRTLIGHDAEDLR